MGRHGENIRKRKDGRWEARYIQFYDENGKAVYRYIYGKTYSEAKSKRNAALVGHNLSTLKSDRKMQISFEQLIEQWLEYKNPQIKSSTLATYTTLIEKHLLPELGKKRLSVMSTSYIEQFLLSKLSNGRLNGKGGLSRKTVSDLRSLLKMILDYGKKKGYFCPSDLNFHVPSGNLPQIQILTESDCEQLEQILFSEQIPLYLGILVALYGGLRIGEICALQWKDFCFENGTVGISKTLLRIYDTTNVSERKTKIIIESPKSNSSNRVIPLPDFLMDYLSTQKKQGECYLLTGTEKYIEPRCFLNKYKQVLKKANIHSYSFHALRHTFATRCVENGFDIKSLSEIMGHSNISITMQRYVHPTMEQKRVQMNRLTIRTNCGQKNGQSR